MEKHTKFIVGSIALAFGLVASGTGVAWETLGNALAFDAPAALPSQRANPHSIAPAADTTGSVAATAAQKVGVVTILSTLDYDPQDQAAGTGTILTAGGLVLTNNHVIEGSTSIEVTVESTGKSYSATVLGTDATDDIAVLSLSGASGLTTASYAGSSAAAAKGDPVTAIGNAEGTGDLVAASGTVTAIGESITVQGDSAGQTESLTDLIETTADVVPGDSGGPLVNAAGKVVGIDTAASASQGYARRGSSSTTGYAIPIANALSIAKQIESAASTGASSSATITVGYPAFLGVEFARSAQGLSSAELLIGGVIDGTPAEQAGIVAGDTITAVDGTAVASSTELSSIIISHAPGDRITVSWTDAAGAPHSATVTLTSGPAA